MRADSGGAAGNDPAGDVMGIESSLDPAAAAAADALAERLLNAGLGMLDLVSVHLGDQLGWYR